RAEPDEQRFSAAPDQREGPGRAKVDPELAPRDIEDARERVGATSEQGEHLEVGGESGGTRAGRRAIGPEQLEADDAREDDGERVSDEYHAGISGPVENQSEPHETERPHQDASRAR